MAGDRRGVGIGRALMTNGIDRARAMGYAFIILVGDQPYYGRVGFRKVPEDQLILPGPVDPDRLLFLELEKGAMRTARGLVLPPHKFEQRRLKRPSRNQVRLARTDKRASPSKVPNKGSSLTARHPIGVVCLKTDQDDPAKARPLATLVTRGTAAAWPWPSQ